MKLTGTRIDSFVRRPDPAVRVVLIYGPDRGLIRERLMLLSKGVVPDLSDPFRVVDLPAARLKDDPVRLTDEVGALSLTGGRRLIRLRDMADAQAGVLADFLDADPPGDALILVEAGELSPRSSLRKLAEEHPKAAALPCYADEGQGLEAVILSILREHRLTAAPEVLALLTESLGSDRQLTRSELDKLALYVGRPGPVSAEDVRAVLADAAALSLDDLVTACGDGDAALALRLFDRLQQEGTHAVAVLRAVQRHFLTLHGLTGQMIQENKTAELVIATLKPKPHFRAVDRLKRHLTRWPPARLSMALDLLVTCETECKSGLHPPGPVCGRALLQICRAALRR